MISVEEDDENSKKNKTVLVLCQYYPVPDERAFGLTAALSEHIDASETLVLSSLPSHLIPGSAGAEEGDPPLYRLQTSEALAWARRLAQEKKKIVSGEKTISPLPPGAAASGFPAAVVSRAAAENRAALLLVRADARAGAPPASALVALARGAAAAVAAAATNAKSSSFASALGKASAAGTVAAAAAEAADAASARAAVYA